MKLMRWAGLCLAVVPMVACATQYQSPRAARSRPQAEEPCTPTIAPIRNNNLVTTVNINYTYTPKDATAARPWHQEDVVAHLNTLGKAHGNTFAPQNGNPLNFTLIYTINNDGQDHFTGSLR